MRPSDQWYLAFIELLISILAARKCDSLSVLSPLIQGYVANRERIIGISVPKCVKGVQKNRGHTNRQVSHFQGAQMLKWLSREAKKPKPRIHKGYVRSFGGLKMRFLITWLSTINRASVRHFGGLKMSFFNGHKYLASTKSVFRHLVAWKWFLQSSWESWLKNTWLPLSNSS